MANKNWGNVGTLRKMYMRRNAANGIDMKMAKSAEKHGVVRGRKIQSMQDRGPEFPLMERALNLEFLDKRALMRRVTQGWLRFRSRRLMEVHYPLVSLDSRAGECLKGKKRGGSHKELFLSSTGWRQGFCRRHNIRFRKTNHTSTNDPEKTRLIGSKWVKRLQKKKRKYPESHQCSEQGRWKLENQYSLDEAPIIFQGGKTTYADSPRGGLDEQRVAVKEGGSGYRFCSLVVCISSAGFKKFGLIFRGSWDEQSFKTERKKFDKDCFVYFQPNAWMDTVVFDKYTDDLIREFYPMGALDDREAKANRERKLAMYDNLLAHMDRRIRLKMRRNGVDTTTTPENNTSTFQAADAGAIQHVSEMRTKWLEKYCDEDVANLEKFESKMTASEKRILLTKMMGDIYRELKKKGSPSSPDFEEAFRAQMTRYFEKTGCHVRIDGLGLEKITPQALPGFEIAESGDSGCSTPESTDFGSCDEVDTSWDDAGSAMKMSFQLDNSRLTMIPVQRSGRQGRNERRLR